MKQLLLLLLGILFSISAFGAGVTSPDGTLRATFWIDGKNDGVLRYQVWRDEIEFFKYVPTVRDDTRALDAEIGAFAVMARRSGDDWFIGCINADAPREIQAPLSFLDDGVQYEATLYSTDASMNSRTNVAIQNQTVGSNTTLTIHLPMNYDKTIYISNEDNHEKAEMGNLKYVKLRPDKNRPGDETM